MKMMVDFAHDFLQEVLQKDDIAVDFTMGNGFDTLFLAQLTKHVYAFDVQNTALINTKKRLEEAGQENATLILDSHANCRRYLPFYKAGIFNLGYLPGNNHEMTTKTESTLKAVRDALDLLMVKGRLVIVCYPGHDEGKREAEALENFCTHLNHRDYHVACLKMQNKKLSPYLLVIDKAH